MNAGRGHGTGADGGQDGGWEPVGLAGWVVAVRRSVAAVSRKTVIAARWSRLKRCPFSAPEVEMASRARRACVRASWAAVTVVFPPLSSLRRAWRR